MASAKRKLNFQEASKLHGKTVGGRKLRLVKEDEMEDEMYYVSVDTGGDATIKVNNGQVFVGPFDSPETAQAAVGDTAEVVDDQATPVGPDTGDEDDEMGGDDMPPAGGEPGRPGRPEESKAAKSKRTRLEAIRRRVINDILKEAGIDVDTTIGSAEQISAGASGELNRDAVAGKVNQAVADAGKQHDTKDSGKKGPNLDGTDDTPMPKVSNTDHTLDSNGGEMHESGIVARAISPGNLIRVFDRKTNKTVDTGIVMHVKAGCVTLEGDVSYEDEKFGYLKLA